MSIAIFSDLHLSLTQRTDHESLFLKALRELRARDTRELWLLGDIFDLMVGPFEFWTARHPEFFKELEQWQREKRSVVWIQGNHDFFLDELLVKRGVTVSDDSLEREVGGRKVFLAHGDLVNAEDHDYLRWRAFTRHPVLRATLKALPPFLRDRLLLRVGAKLSDKSRAQSRTEGRAELESLFSAYARELWAKGFDGVCLGHSHVETFLEEDRKFFVNLGSWINYSPRCALWKPEGYKYPERYYVRNDGLST